MNITPDAWQADSEAILAELRATRATLELAGRVVARLTEERDQAEARIQAVEALHEESGPINRAGWTKCLHCSNVGLKPFPMRYPCPTSRALDGDA